MRAYRSKRGGAVRFILRAVSLVVLLGAPGGFFLPPLFAYAYQATGIPQTTFVILFLITAASLVWLHVVVQRILREATPQLRNRFEESQQVEPPALIAPPVSISAHAASTR